MTAQLTPEVLQARRYARGQRFMTYCIVDAHIASVLIEDARRDGLWIEEARLKGQKAILLEDQIEYARDAGIIQ